MRLAAALVVVLALLALAGVVVDRVVLAELPPPPALPQPVAAVAAGWPDEIQLPETLPACLRYAPHGAAVAPNDTAQGGWSLWIRLTAADQPGCSGWQDADLFIEEAPALASLSGSVTTASDDRMEFAQAIDASGGQRRLTLQWRCRDVICRLSGTLAGASTEEALTQLAASFEPAQT